MIDQVDFIVVKCAAVYPVYLINGSRASVFRIQRGIALTLPSL